MAWRFPRRKILYVANSDAKRNLWLAFDLNNEGDLTNERVFFDATPLPRPGLADGMKVHSKGYVLQLAQGRLDLFSSRGTFRNNFN